MLYDGWSVILERNHSGETVARYTRGVDYGGGIRGLISVADHQSQGSSNLYYQYDGGGNVVQLTGARGLPTVEYSYDAFGNERQPAVSGPANRYRFSTKESADADNLIYFGSRYYSPPLGRWISKDPTGMSDGINMYAYVGNSPVNYIDQWGAGRKQRRPLDKPGLRSINWWIVSHSRLTVRDESGVLRDFGYYDDSKVRPDDAPESLQSAYKDVGPELDDGILLEAIRRVKHEWDKDLNPEAQHYDFYQMPYSGLVGALFHRVCHDLVDAVEREYRSINYQRSSSSIPDVYP
jgi:RHS repeat-associated protein